MRATALLRDHPVLLLGVAVVGLVVWVAADAPAPPAAPPGDPPGSVPPGDWALSGPPPDGVLPSPVRGRYPNEPGAVNALLLDRLFPGMTRREVEDLLGVPPADRVAAVARDRLTYRTTYPIARPPAADGPPPGLVALEFDASRPGHPLLRVHRAETF
jgi:hypothetical protein